MLKLTMTPLVKLKAWNEANQVCMISKQLQWGTAAAAAVLACWRSSRLARMLAVAKAHEPLRCVAQGLSKDGPVGTTGRTEAGTRERTWAHCSKDSIHVAMYRNIG